MDNTEHAPDPIAMHDQAHADARQKARVVGAYYVQLVEEGVPEYEAMRLTLSYQRRWLFPDASVAPDDDDEG